MKALLLQRHGDLDDVVFGDRARPEIKADEVLLEVKAAALNGLDLWIIEGWPALRVPLPHVFGSDGAGIVAAVGSEVDAFAVGDRVAVNPTVWCGECAYCRAGKEHMCDHFAVMGEHVPGFYAQYTAVPARNLTLLPEDVPFEDAAAASLVFVTAWHSLIEAGKLQAGEDVLVIGAGGGISTAAIQIARLAGARHIYVVGSSEEKLALAQTLGADVLINRREEEWSKAVYLRTGRRGVDVVVDNVGAATYHGSLRALRKGGRLLTVGNSSGPQFKFDNRYMFGKHLSIIGSTMGTHRDYEKVMGLLFEGRLRAVIDTVLPLGEGLEALRRLQAGEVAGKLVLRP